MRSAIAIAQTCFVLLVDDEHVVKAIDLAVPERTPEKFVIFGALVVRRVVAELLDERRPDEECRVLECGVVAQLAPDRLVTAGGSLVEKMLPLLVHDVGESAEQIAIRIAIHMEFLQRDTPGIADIAAIHARDVFVAGVDDVGEPVIERSCDALVAIEPQDLEVVARLQHAGDRLA